MNDRALFILDKLIKRDTPKFQAGWAAAFPGRLMYEPRQIQSDEVTRGPWLVILTRMGATREETTDIKGIVRSWRARWWRTPLQRVCRPAPEVGRRLVERSTDYEEQSTCRQRSSRNLLPAAVRGARRRPAPTHASQLGHSAAQNS